MISNTTLHWESEKVDLTRRYFQPTTYTYNPKTLEPQKMIANTTAMNAANDDINPSIKPNRQLES